MWKEPGVIARNKLAVMMSRNAKPGKADPSGQDGPSLDQSLGDDGSGDEDGILLHDVVFDAEKMVSCSVENGSILVHGSGGRGYGLGATVISSGCYQWSVSHSWPI